ncbi:MAG: hypothetical protein AAGE03_06880 [Pseudomonadota bacterium]
MIYRHPDRSGWVTGELAKIGSEGPFPEFTSLEDAVLHALAPQLGEWEATYLRQLESAAAADRINTGVGFYTRVRVDTSACAPLPHGLSKNERSIAGDHFSVREFDHGLGIILWEAQGFLQTIEGYTCNESSSGRQLAEFDLQGVFGDTSANSRLGGAVSNTKGKSQDD